MDPIQGRGLESAVVVTEVGQVGLVARDHEDRHFRKVLHQPLRRRHQSSEVVVREEIGDHRPAGHAQIGLPVQDPYLADEGEDP